MCKNICERLQKENRRQSVTEVDQQSHRGLEQLTVGTQDLQHFPICFVISK